MSQSRSRTVDLALDVEELRAFVYAGWQLDRYGILPDVAVSALIRLNTAAHDGRGTVWKVDRRSLQSLVDAIRPHVPKLVGAVRELGPAVAKVDARLASSVGRPRVPQASAVWRDRATAVERARLKLLAANGYEPTDEQIAAAVGIKYTALRIWRHRHPALFGPPRG